MYLVCWVYGTQTHEQTFVVENLIGKLTHGRRETTKNEKAQKNRTFTDQKI